MWPSPGGLLTSLLRPLPTAPSAPVKRPAEAEKEQGKRKKVRCVHFGMLVQGLILVFCVRSITIGPAVSSGQASGQAPSPGRARAGLVTRAGKRSGDAWWQLGLVL